MHFAHPTGRFVAALAMLLALHGACHAQFTPREAAEVLASPELAAEQEWNAFVARQPEDQRTALREARLASLLDTLRNKTLETKKRFLRESARLLAQGVTPKRPGRDRQPWTSIQAVVESLPDRSDPEYLGLAGRMVIDQLLPLVPADAPFSSDAAPSSFLNSVGALPERDAIALLEALHRRHGRLSLPGDTQSLGKAMAANASPAVLRALVEVFGVTEHGWRDAVRAGRMDVLDDLHAMGERPPAAILVSAPWVYEQSKRLDVFDWLLDKLPRPLPPELANQTLANLLVAGPTAATFDAAKWPRIDRLLARGADLTQAFAIPHPDGAFRRISLLRAHPDVAIALLERGLDPSASIPPLDDNLLINYLMLPDHTDPGATGVRTEVVAAMVKRHDLLNQYSRKFRRFPLYISIANSPAQGRQLMGLGADPTVRDPYGHTLLALAAGFGDEDVAQFLIQHGADLAAVDRAGVSALGYARCYRRTAVVALLEAAQAPELGRAVCEAALARDKK